MTLKTAKQIVEDGNGARNKEAEAVIRGGMTYCEQKDNGKRVYLWLKVFPTKTDEESSIKLAIENYQNRKKRRTTIKEKGQIPQEPITATLDHTVTDIEKPQGFTTITLSQLLEKIKKKMRNLWQQIDEIVIE